MMRRSILFFILVLTSFSLEALTFKEKLKESKVGNFVVTEQNNTLSLLRVHSLSKERLILEEITCPPNFTPKKGNEWATWIKEGAPQHSSWILIEIDLENEEVLECFSFTRNAWLLLHKDDSFLLKLCNLSLQPVPSSKRRKIGPAPLEGPDMRKLWTPPIIVAGEKKQTQFDVYEVKWPKDSTPLSNKRVELYFDHNQKEFPFPYWAQVTDDSGAAFKVRVIDSGENLPTSGKTLPRRPMTLTKKIEWTDLGITLECNCPKYYKNFTLSAIDHTAREKKSISLPFTVQEEGEKKVFLISQKALDTLLLNDHSYSLLLTSDNLASTESKDLFVFKQTTP